LHSEHQGEVTDDYAEGSEEGEMEIIHNYEDFNTKDLDPDLMQDVSRSFKPAALHSAL